MLCRGYNGRGVSCRDPHHVSIESMPPRRWQRGCRQHPPRQVCCTTGCKVPRAKWVVLMQVNCTAGSEQAGSEQAAGAEHVAAPLHPADHPHSGTEWGCCLPVVLPSGKFLQICHRQANSKGGHVRAAPATSVSHSVCLPASGQCHWLVSEIKGHRDQHGHGNDWSLRTARHHPYHPHAPK